MSSPSPGPTLWQLARVGIAAQQSLRLRLALIRVEARDRGRHVRRGLALAILGLVLASAAILMGLAALAMLLMSHGFTPHAALGLVAGGATALALLLLLLGRSALLRATSSRS
ncbi:hypothetical protein G5V65_05355 [Rhodobacter sp. HX-7-19]|uniref:Phage holin family protein n=1 Tax=Paragemmobacter kunshanensis TaxID=2583234 RepID=A0A6M1U2K3_9RHOB|nr:phage holin family protein [Rhodobacter kunshanensis]NGQ90315.1 hypothetical protein [Rhodobacter kunshanensis]